jgi:predicted DNA-binding transcriptional regulator AlpA
MNRSLPYPPPWQDAATLASHICVSATTIDNWVAQGIIPAPRKRGGKLMWEWAEVDDWLRNGPHNGELNAVGMRDAVRKVREAQNERH